MSDTPHVAQDPEAEEAAVEAAKASYLRFEEIETVYEPDDIARAFSDIMSEMKPVKPGQFASVAAAIGTHSLKTLTPRASQSFAKGAQAVFTVGDAPLMFSGGAADSPVAKLLLRPINIRGLNAPTSLIGVITRGGAMAAEIKDAFASVFGDDALEEVSSVGGRGTDHVTVLPVKNFPIIFLPHPDGDVQATPISPLSSFMSGRKEASPFFHKKKGADDKPRRGRFKRTEVSSKMQNISPQLFGGKLRMIAAVPRLSTSRQAMIWAFANGRRMPRIDEADIADMLVRFAQLNEADIAGANSLEVTRGADNLMSLIVSKALDHAVSCCEEAQAVKPDFAAPKDVSLTYLTLHLLKDRVSKAKNPKERDLREREMASVSASMNGAGRKWSEKFDDQYLDYVRRVSK